MITVTPIQKRFADVDMLGHVNNVNQQHYFDLGKSDYFTQVINGPTSWTKEGLIAVATNTNYMAQIWYNEPIVVRTRLEKIGNKSLTLFQQIVNTQTEEVLDGQQYEAKELDQELQDVFGEEDVVVLS